jgi:clusterin-associated protein 1
VYTSNTATHSLSLSLSLLQIKEVIVRAEENVVTLEKQKRDLDADKKALTTKIKKKKADLDRSGKRLKSLQEVRPAFMDEYEKLESELQVIYMQQRELD